MSSRLRRECRLGVEGRDDGLMLHDATRLDVIIAAALSEIACLVLYIR